MAKIVLAGEEILATRDTLIAQNHPHLALIKDEIAVVFKEKASKVGLKEIAGQTKKAGELIKLLSGKDYVFVIELATDAWARMDDDERIALIDHQLCFCAGEEKEDGSMKWFLDRPDISYFRQEVLRHGFWSTSGQKASEIEIDHVFGPDSASDVVMN